MKRTETLSSRIRKLRLSLDLTQGQAARRIGKTVSYWAAIEVGRKNISEHALRRLAEGFGLSQRVVCELEELRAAFKIVKRYDLSEKQGAKQELIQAFARSFDRLTPRQVEEIMKVLNRPKHVESYPPEEGKKRGIVPS